MRHTTVSLITLLIVVIVVAGVSLMEIILRGLLILGTFMLGVSVGAGVVTLAANHRYGRSIRNKRQRSIR